jgi:Fe2+ or Zn2+ uptake regulation protein
LIDTACGAAILQTQNNLRAMATIDLRIDHILCVKCGRVDEFIDEVIEERQHAVAKKMGYKMTDHSLYVYGICPACNS